MNRLLSGRHYRRFVFGNVGAEYAVERRAIDGDESGRVGTKRLADLVGELLEQRAQHLARVGREGGDVHERLDLGIARRGRRLLDGYRGTPPADRDDLVDLLLRVSRLVTDCPEVQELDLNPVVALPPGQGVRVLVARIRCARTSAADAAIRSLTAPARS